MRVSCYNVMISSSFYSFDDTSSWDPKLLRRYLYISEDQLETLNDLPGWSKVDEDPNVRRIIRGTESTILSSQASEHESELYLSNNNKVNHYCNKNIELFNKHLEDRRKILKICEFSCRKRNKSSSAIDSLKKHPNFSKTASLKRTLSIPHININFEYFTSESREFLLNKTYTLSSESQTRSKDLFTNTVNESSSSLDHFRRNIPIQSQIDYRKQSSESMEVITQLPVNVSRSEKVVNDDITVEIQVNQDVSTNVQIPQAQLDNSYQINGNVTENCASNNLNDKSVHESVSLQETKISENFESISYTKPTISESNMQNEKPERQIVVLPHTADGDKESDCSASVSTLPEEKGEEAVPLHSEVNDKVESNSLASVSTRPEGQGKEAIQEPNEMSDKMEMDSFGKLTASKTSMISCTNPTISKSNIQREKPARETVPLHTADNEKAESNFSASMSGIMSKGQDKETVPLHSADIDKVESNSSPSVSTLPKEQGKEAIHEPNEISDKMEMDSFNKRSVSKTSTISCTNTTVSESNMQKEKPAKETVPLYAADGDKVASNSSASIITMLKGQGEKPVQILDKMEMDSFNEAITSKSSMFSSIKQTISESNMQKEKSAIETVAFHIADGDKVGSNSSASISTMSKGQGKKAVQAPDEIPDKMEVDSFNKPIASESNMFPEKEGEINIECQNAVQIMLKEVSQGPSGECILLHVNSTYNPSDNHENCNLQSIQKSCHEVVSISADKPLDNPVTVKRKADTKRNAKKHRSQDKKGHTHRNVKKAGNIIYSKEEIETMLNVLKQFL